MAKQAEKKEGPSVKEVMQAKADQTVKNLQSGGKAVKISLTNTTNVVFTKDYGFIKAGHKQKVSDLALEIYQKAGVVEKI